MIFYDFFFVLLSGAIYWRKFERAANGGKPKIYIKFYGISKNKRIKIVRWGTFWERSTCWPCHVIWVGQDLEFGFGVLGKEHETSSLATCRILMITTKAAWLLLNGRLVANRCCSSSYVLCPVSCVLGASCMCGYVSRFPFMPSWKQCWHKEADLFYLRGCQHTKKLIVIVVDLFFFHFLRFFISVLKASRKVHDCV